MKKLMIAAAIVCAAVASQASSFNWKTAMSSGALYNESTTATYTGTAYLFSTGDLTQQQVLTAWAEGSFSTAKALATKDISSAGKISSSSNPFDGFEWGTAGDNLTTFVVVDDGSKIFISDTKTMAADVAKTQTFQFALTPGSQTAALETTTFGSQGWYTAASVPEPTSGLLLLLGVAGMALRRRRA